MRADKRAKAPLGKAEEKSAWREGEAGITPGGRSGKEDESPVIQREAERPSEESHAWAEKRRMNCAV